MFFGRNDAKAETPVLSPSSHSASSKVPYWDFPGGAVLKNLPCNAEHVNFIPRFGSKISHATEQVSLCTATTEALTL